MSRAYLVGIVEKQSGAFSASVYSEATPTLHNSLYSFVLLESASFDMLGLYVRQPHNKWLINHISVRDRELINLL